MLLELYFFHNNNWVIKNQLTPKNPRVSSFLAATETSKHTQLDQTSEWCMHPGRRLLPHMAIATLMAPVGPPRGERVTEIYTLWISTALGPKNSEDLREFIGLRGRGTTPVERKKKTVEHLYWCGYFIEWFF